VGQYSRTRCGAAALHPLQLWWYNTFQKVYRQQAYYNLEVSMHSDTDLLDALQTDLAELTASR
jgi:hypothetical protein